MGVCMATTTGNLFANRMLNLHRIVKSNLTAGLLRHMPTTESPQPPPMIRLFDNSNKTTLVVDVDQLLQRKSSPVTTLFPPFFLLAVEAGGFVRGLVLLVFYPVLRLLTHGMFLKAMVMVCFCGLRRDEAVRIGRAVLPKYFFQEAADMEALEAVGTLPKAVTVAAVSRSFPTVMVETFLKEYVGFDVVVGREVKADAGSRYFAGVMEEDDETTDIERLRALLKHTEKNACHYPKPLIFHDGRLAFTPTPASALAMYVYFPLGVALAVVRIAIYTLLPRRVSSVVAALFGVRMRVIGASLTADGDKPHGGRLYACNHRTLLDPIAISSAIGKPVTAVTYSLSRLSEVLSPIPLLRLTREREEDRRRMASLLSQGDVVVCPEGTTCREPYLLRFSPLFAELVGEVSPVAVDARASMFYGTSTAPGAKCFDSVYFLMNPRPEYSVQFLEPVPTGGGSSSIEVANRVQCVLADALGFEATVLTRKDKYLLLAGNEGVVATKGSKN